MIIALISFSVRVALYVTAIITPFKNPVENILEMLVSTAHFVFMHWAEVCTLCA